MFPKSNEGLFVGAIGVVGLGLIDLAIVYLATLVIPKEILGAPLLVMISVIGCAYEGMRFSKIGGDMNMPWWAYVLGDAVGLSLGVHWFTALPAIQVFWGILLISPLALVVAYHTCRSYLQLKK